MAVRRRRAAKKKVTKSIIPNEVLSYLKHDLCNSGVLALKGFLESTEPEKVVKAVLAAVSGQIKRAEADADRLLAQTKENLESDTGRKVEIKFVV